MSELEKLKRIRKQLLRQRGMYYVVRQMDLLIEEREKKRNAVKLKVAMYALTLMLGMLVGSLVFR